MNTWWKKNDARLAKLAIKYALSMDRLTVQEIAELRTLTKRRRKYKRDYIYYK